MKKEEIFEYVQKQYGTVPEYLWSKLPDSAVLQQKSERKRNDDCKRNQPSD